MGRMRSVTEALNLNGISKTAVQQGVSSAATVRQAIQTASAQSGVSFSYLLQKAEQESGMNPNARAQGSSATGLYQFVDQTWLREIKAHGADYGYGALADKITLGSDGTARVSDAATKSQILALRKDPTLSSQMAAELTKDNKASLEQKVGGKIGGTELYLAHFLGAGGATNLLSTMKSNPNAKAADVLPTAAAANKAVFYDKNGNARSVSQVYAMFDKKFDGLESGTTAVASATTTAKTARVASLNGGMTEDAVASQILSGRTASLNLSQFSTPLSAMILAQMDPLGEKDETLAGYPKRTGADALTLSMS